jgi:rod shape-determining protein MreC
MIGKIIQVERDISVARLVNDNQSSVGATMLNRDRSLGVVEGGFGISLQMNLIPRDEVVQIGDSIVTSGLEEFIPRGLVLGTVASIENEAYKPFQKAIVTPGVDLSKLTIVSIVSGK